MTREEALRMVRAYGAAIERGDRAGAAEHGMNLVDALMKIKEGELR